MSLITQRYGAILSVSLSPIAGTAMVNVDNVARQTAEKRIRLSPTSAQGYLELGVFFIRQANYQDALSVYKHGLRFVTEYDDRRAELETQRDIMLNILDRHTLRYRHLLPYDVWCHIFGNLEIKDLLQMACVCRSWCDFMIQWPTFWKLLSYELPEIKQSAVQSLKHSKPQEFYLNGPVDTSLVCHTVRFLTCSSNGALGKLAFKNLILTEEDTIMLSNVLQLAGSMVQQVEFIDCIIPRHKVIKPILESCSSIPRISFSRSTITPKSYRLKRPRWYQTVIPCKSYTSLTYLKLCVETMGFDPGDGDRPMETDRLSAILRQCPNLIHLLLDSGGTVYHGHCINQAIQYCPRLKTLAVSDKAEIPTTVMGIDDDKRTTMDSDQSDSSKLQRLILSGGRIKIESDDISFALKSAHSTLEFLFLHYGGGGGVINPTVFFHLARLGVPCLREIRLSTESGADACDDQLPMTTALSALFCHCPALEAITIEDTFSTGFNPHHGRLDVDDHVLNSIAKHCSQLRYLRVIGQRCHTNRGILDFAEARRNKLVYLEIDTERSTILALVKILVALENLHIRRDSLVHKDRISDDAKKDVQDIFRWRGGVVTWT